MAKSSIDISGFVHAAMIGSKAGPLMLLTLMKAQTPRRNDALAKKNCLALMLPIPPLALTAADGSFALHMMLILGVLHVLWYVGMYIHTIVACDCRTVTLGKWLSLVSHLRSAHLSILHFVLFVPQ